MEVTFYTINKGQPSQYYGLKTVDDNQVLYGAPNNWKTIKGAVAWALRHGMTIVCGGEAV